MLKKILRYTKQHGVKQLFYKTLRAGFFLIIKKTKKYFASEKKLKEKAAINHLWNTILIIDHNLGGGANLYRENTITTLLAQGATVGLLVHTVYFGKHSHHQLTIYKANKIFHHTIYSKEALSIEFFI